MRARTSLACFVLLALVALAPFPGWRAEQVAGGENASDLEGGLSSVFVENAGQIRREDVRYYVALGDLQVGFGPSFVLLRLLDHGEVTAEHGPLPRISLPNHQPPSPRSIAVHLEFEGANSVVPIGRGELPHLSHFFLGGDPGAWRTSVRSYREILYRDLYDGIDLVYRVDRGFLKYDFLVQPGSEVSSILVSYAGVQGLEVDAAGDMLIRTPLGTLRDSAPLCTQGQHPVPCQYELRGESAIGFRAAWDRSLPLKIDPMVFGTYLGASGEDDGRRMAVDLADNVYVVGITNSVDFPATPGLDPTLGGRWDAFVAKLDATGRFLHYATFVGGTGSEFGIFDIAVDDLGQAHIVGSTESTDFPLTSDAFDASKEGTWDAFLVTLDPAGGLSYGTYVGGSAWDYGTAVAVDSLGDVIVAGETGSTDFPVTAGAYDPSPNGDRDVFVIRLARSSLRYGTFLGGSERDFLVDIDLDPSGDLYLGGFTVSIDFPTTPFAHDRTYGGGFVDGFAAKLEADGGALLFGTYLGGVSSESVTGIRAGIAGAAYVVGSTISGDFPTTPGAYDRILSDLDTFVSELSPMGALVFSTLLGVYAANYGESIDVDAAGNVYVVGYTDSARFPATADAFDRTCGTDGACNFNGVRRYFDAFLAKFNSDGSALLYATFLGGSDAEWGTSVVLESPRRVFISGVTWSGDFPTTLDAFDTSFNGIHDSYVVKLDLGGVNVPPTLSWAGMEGFEADGLDPEWGMTYSEFTYTVVYADADDDAPAIVDLEIERPLGSLWRTIPLTLRSWVGSAGGFDSGAVYVASTQLPAGTDYWYRFRASDGLALATGPPTAPIEAPDVVVDNPPTALADTSSTITWRGNPLTFDASRSTDDFGIVAYEWDLGDGTMETGPVVQHAYALPGSYEITLIVWDTSNQSDVDTLAINIQNRPPTADAGRDQVELKNVPVTLSGTGSGDLDGDPLTYAWVQTAGPTVALVGANTATASFTPTVSGTLAFSLTVGDGWGGSSNDTVIVTVCNRAPIANAGPDRTLPKNAPVTLDGTGSSDPDGDVLTYAWSQDAGPAVVLAGGDTPTPTFTPPRSGVYEFRLTASDGDGGDAADSVQVTATNRPPIADAGSDRTSQKRGVVTLDGSRSSDRDGDRLSFAWTQVSGPPVVLTGADTATPAFTPPETDAYAFRLLVYDGDGGASEDVVTVTTWGLAPIAHLVARPPNAVVGAPIAFDATGSSDPDGTIADLEFDFGDGTGTHGAATGRDHSYTAAGAYTVTLAVTDDDGNVSTALVIVEVDPAPPPATVNWKPFVAAVFASVLAAAGAWASQRRPWRAATARRASLIAFVLTSLPFVIVEVATGIVSFLTGLLSIPPIVGPGTFVDAAILIVGLTVAFIRLRRKSSLPQRSGLA